MVGMRATPAAAAALLLLLSGCALYEEDLGSTEVAEPTVEVSEATTTAPPRPAPREKKPPRLDEEAARQACLLYNDTATGLMSGALSTREAVEGFHGVAALAMVAGDGSRFEAAADELWFAAQEGPVRRIKRAARAFVAVCEGAVPGHRFVAP